MQIYIHFSSPPIISNIFKTMTHRHNFSDFHLPLNNFILLSSWCITYDLTSLVVWTFLAAALSASAVMERKCASPSMWHIALNGRLITEGCSHPPTLAQSAAAGGPQTASPLTFQSEEKIKIICSFSRRFFLTPSHHIKYHLCVCHLKRWPCLCAADKHSWHCINTGEH